MLSFAASVAKYQQDSRLNEDAFGERTSHGVYAVSDGASESFDSRRWSKLLVQLFLETFTSMKDGFATLLPCTPENLIGGRCRGAHKPLLTAAALQR